MRHVKLWCMLGVMAGLAMAGTVRATMIPADGDAWTESSTAGWASPATVALSADHAVGNASITSGMKSGGGSLSVTFTPVDAGDPSAVIHFWQKIITTDSSYNAELDIFNSTNDTYLIVPMYNRSGTQGWAEYTLNLHSLNSWAPHGQPFDYSHLSGVGMWSSWVDEPGATTEFLMDGLYFNNVVPEPCTLALVGMGLLGWVRRRG